MGNRVQTCQSKQMTNDLMCWSMIYEERPETRVIHSNVLENFMKKIEQSEELEITQMSKQILDIINTCQEIAVEARRNEVRFMSLQNFFEFSRNEQSTEFLEPIIELMGYCAYHMRIRVRTANAIKRGIGRTGANEIEIEAINKFIEHTKKVNKFSSTVVMHYQFAKTRFRGFLDYLNEKDSSIISELDNRILRVIHNEFYNKQVDKIVYGNRLRELCFDWYCRVDTKLTKYPEHREKGETSDEVLSYKGGEMKKDKEAESMIAAESINDTIEREKKALMYLLKIGKIGDEDIEALTKLEPDEKLAEVNKYYTMYKEVIKKDTIIDPVLKEQAEKEIEAFKHRIVTDPIQRKAMKNRISNISLHEEAHIIIEAAIVDGVVIKPYILGEVSDNFYSSYETRNCVLRNNKIDDNIGSKDSTGKIKFIHTQLLLSLFI